MRRSCQPDWDLTRLIQRLSDRMLISLMKTSRFLSAFIVALTLAPTARAEVKPNPLFSDGAVLQQNAIIPI